MGAQAISDWLEGGGLKFFLKKFRGGSQQFYRELYFIRAPLAKISKAVTDSRVQTIYVKQ